MRFPIGLNLKLSAYLLRNRLAGRARFPLVLMLEPTHNCNLRCYGCGKVREYLKTLKEVLPLERCLAAAEECGAPVVSICGGEPTMYEPIGELVAGLLRQGRQVFCCTHGGFLPDVLHKFRPDRAFTFNVSLDGLAETHDRTHAKKGTFDLALRGLRAAKRAGFRVVTNTTIFTETGVDEVHRLFEFLEGEGVDGFLVSPAYHYEAIRRSDIFMHREEIDRKFAEIFTLRDRFRFFNTPLYLRFLTGERDLPCTPWGNVTFNPRGWKGPCYLITDGHYATFRELMACTDWDRYEAKADPRCRDCKMHSGFEASVVRLIGRNPRDVVELVRWNLS